MSWVGIQRSRDREKKETVNEWTRELGRHICEDSVHKRNQEERKKKETREQASKKESERVREPGVYQELSWGRGEEFEKGNKGECGE